MGSSPIGGMVLSLTEFEIEAMADKNLARAKSVLDYYMMKTFRVSEISPLVSMYDTWMGFVALAREDMRYLGVREEIICKCLDGFSSNFKANPNYLNR